MKNKKRRLLFPFLLVCLLLMGMNVSAEELRFSQQDIQHEGIDLTPDLRYAVPIENTEAQSGKRITGTTTVTYASNSELNPPQKWEFNISRSRITGSLKDATVSSACRWGMSVRDSNLESDQTDSAWGKIANGSLSVNISSLPNGKYSLLLWRGDTVGDTSLSALKVYSFSVSGTSAYFTSSGYENEKKAMSQVTAKLNPEHYNKIPEIYYADVYKYQKELSKIIRTAKSVTSGCSTAEQKFEKIHDWICDSISYDYDVLNKNTTVISTRNNPFYVYKYRRGVCGGFSRLMQIMLTSVDVPCAYIEGNGGGGDITNHAWNVVWIDGKWREVDSTWDCRNRYEQSKLTRYAKTYSYYAAPVFFFSDDHQSHYYYSYQYVKSISVSASPKKTFQKGSRFSVSDGQLAVIYGNGSRRTIPLTSSMCSGYDGNRYGKQTITVSYGGVKTSYRINVIPKKGAGFTVGSLKYRITKASASKGTVEVASVKNAKSITIPQSVTIKGYKFKVTGIASKAFQKCGKLKKLTIQSVSIKKVGSKAFLGIRGAAKIYVPAKKYTAYQKLMRGKGQTSKVKIKKY